MLGRLPRRARTHTQEKRVVSFHACMQGLAFSSFAPNPPNFFLHSSPTSQTPPQPPVPIASTDLSIFEELQPFLLCTIAIHARVFTWCFQPVGSQVGCYHRGMNGGTYIQTSPGLLRLLWEVVLELVLAIHSKYRPWYHTLHTYNGSVEYKSKGPRPHLHRWC